MIQSYRHTTTSASGLQDATRVKVCDEFHSFRIGGEAQYSVTSKEVAHECGGFVRDGYNLVGRLTIKLEVEFSLQATVLPIREEFQLASVSEDFSTTPRADSAEAHEHLPSGDFASAMTYRRSACAPCKPGHDTIHRATTTERTSVMRGL